MVAAEALSALAERINVSLNDMDVSNDLMIFTETPIRLQGVEKAGAFNRVRAIIHRPTWLEYERMGRVDKQMALVYLESLLFLGVQKERYESAGEFFYIDPKSVTALYAQS